MANLFERLDRRPPPTEEAVKRPRSGSPPIEMLLDWLVNDWPKPTIAARDIYTYGPNSIRDRNTVLSLARILVERRWLVPIETHQHNMRKWKIARGGTTTLPHPPRPDFTPNNT